MNAGRVKRAKALIVELAAIQAEVEVLKDGEQAEAESLLADLEVGMLVDAGNAVGEAIEALKGAIM